jgi:hypothetical protein
MTEDAIYGADYLAKFKRLESIESTWALNRWRAEKARMSLVDSAPVIIDVGCAAGTFIKAMKNKLPCARVVGIDINPLAVAECTAASIEAYTNEQFEYVWENHFSKFHLLMTFWDSLEHMRDPIGFLDKYKPNQICVSLPCLDGFLMHHSSIDIVLWKHHRPLEHLWTFTAYQFQEFMKRAGYKVDEGPIFGESFWRRDDVLGEKNIMTFILSRV